MNNYNVSIIYKMKKQSKLTKPNYKTTKTKMKDFYKELDIIDTPLVKPVHKSKKKYNKVVDNIPLVEDYNFQADLLFLPETKEGFKYLFVVVDLSNREFDIEPLKDKKPETTLKALKTIFKRKHLNKPFASFKTDNGNEFKSVFHKYLVDEKILHKVALTGRHRYTAVVERLNRELGKVFNHYMNSKEIKTGKPYNEWTDILNEVREKLNKIRKLELLPQNKYHYEPFLTSDKPKFKIGQMVHRLLDEPRNALNEKQSTSSFREGDFRFSLTHYKIKDIVYFSGNVNYRYILEGIHGTSFAEFELIPSTLDIEDEVGEIKSILDKTYNRKEKMWYYKIWFHGEPKSKSSWLSKNDLLETISEDILNDFVKIYEDKKKKKKK